MTHALPTTPRGADLLVTFATLLAEALRARARPAHVLAGRHRRGAEPSAESTRHVALPGP